MKKKLLSLLMAAMMMTAILAGCGGDTAPADDSVGDGSGAVANPDYPNNGTINCVVGWSAGGTTDLVARKAATTTVPMSTALLAPLPPRR